MTLDQTIELIQPACYEKLLSEPWFANVAVFKIREKRLDSEVSQALAGIAGRNGCGGASIEVLMTEFSDQIPGSPGPVTEVQQVFLVKTQDTINLGATGAGLSCEQIAGRIAQTFHRFALGIPKMSSLDARGDFYLRVHSGFDSNGDLNPFITIQITLRATLAPDAIPLTSTPAIATAAGGGNVTVTLTDQQPGGGSTIYYTTDGTFPGAGNSSAGNPAGGTAQVYAEPFTVAAGTTVLFAAYITSFAGSLVDGGVVN